MIFQSFSAKRRSTLDSRAWGQLALRYAEVARASSSEEGPFGERAYTVPSSPSQDGDLPPCSRCCAKLAGSSTGTLNAKVASPRLISI